MGIVKFRLRTKFLFSLFLVGAALTLTTVFVARRTVERQVRLQLQDLDLGFYLQMQREQNAEHSAHPWLIFRF